MKSNKNDWILWGSQESVIVDSDSDLESLMRRSGRTSWSVWFNTGAREGLAFISAKMVNDTSVQYTIRKRVTDDKMSPELFPIGSRVILIQSGAAGAVVKHVKANKDDQPAKKAHKVRWDSHGTISYVRPGRLQLVKEEK